MEDAAPAAPQQTEATDAQMAAAAAARGGGNGTMDRNANGAQANLNDEPGLDGYERYVLESLFCNIDVPLFFHEFAFRHILCSFSVKHEPSHFFLFSSLITHRECPIITRTEVIGQGAYGVVYRGNRTATNEQVAIKRIPFADQTPEGGVPCNVIREISLLRELDHPNVVKLLDVIQAQPGGLYLVFEFVAHDLKSFMDQYQTSDDINERVGLPQPMVKSFMKQILAGVGFCHTYRVLHRDLKPHNVSLDKAC